MSNLGPSRGSKDPPGALVSFLVALMIRDHDTDACFSQLLFKLLFLDKREAAMCQVARLDSVTNEYQNMNILFEQHIVPLLQKLGSVARDISFDFCSLNHDLTIARNTKPIDKIIKFWLDHHNFVSFKKQPPPKQYQFKLSFSLCFEF